MPAPAQSDTSYGRRAIFRIARWRRPFLVIVGGTNSGKSLLAAKVLTRIGVVLRVPGFVEITVETDEDLDLSSYDHRAHAGILLDGVGDTLTLWRRCEMLQGRPTKCGGGGPLR